MAAATAKKEWRRCNGGGTGRTAGDDGGCFEAVLEWFWEHKIQRRMYRR